MAALLPWGYFSETPQAAMTTSLAFAMTGRTVSPWAELAQNGNPTSAALDHAGGGKPGYGQAPAGADVGLVVATTEVAEPVSCRGCVAIVDAARVVAPASSQTSGRSVCPRGVGRRAFERQTRGPGSSASVRVAER